jgi:N-acetyl-gamma-glutamyl-phosphate reductase
VSKIRAGIINVTGYAGVELARLLSKHPEAEISSVTGRSQAGQKLGTVFPHLSDLGLTITAELGECDVAFSALPQKESVKECMPLLDKGVKVIDISADFRLKDPADYPKWYGFTHPAPELLREAVYGLPELNRLSIAKARLVANPGCYPTGAILALAPALKAGVIESDIIIDSKSGVSGAGRTLTLNTHYSEVNEDVSAYSLDGHRHLPEISQELAVIHPAPPPGVTFVPHLIPMTRGILTTAYAKLAVRKTHEELMNIYKDFYNGEPFVRVAEASPHTKHTWGNNLCIVYPVLDARQNRLIVISAIDNLVKGAAGQAIQNMNLMFGIPETTGLDAVAVYP